MADFHELSVVIPVYNEAESLPTLINDWYDLFQLMEISFLMIVIDDGSNDESQSILETIQKLKPNLSVVSHANIGHGPSIYKGYLKGLTSEWVFQIDGDHQFETKAFQDLWKNRANHDLLLAERESKQASISRRMISSVSSHIIRAFFGEGIHDVNSPYRLIRTQPLQDALKRIEPASFAPNLLISAYFVFTKKRIYTNRVGLRKVGVKNQSRMSLYILKGCIQSILSVIKFRLSI